MKDKKLQVFVSSTYTDLKEERQAAVEAILSAGHIPAGMELFTAGDQSQMTVIERWIDESDVYLLILGGRYGSVDPNTGKGYTHLEYEYAVEKKKPLFAVVINDATLEDKVRKHGTSVVELKKPELLAEFKKHVLSNLVKFWSDNKDIKLAVFETLSEFSYTRKELVGWVRGDNTVNAGALAEEIARLTKENSELRSQISNNKPINEPLFAGLNYEQLTNLLKKELVVYEVDGYSINLFDCIKKYGLDLTTGVYPKDKLEHDICRLLIIYKLVYSTQIAYSKCYKFTDDGHNYYLRSLVDTEQSSPN